MNELCQMIVFSKKAYNAIIRESFDKDPVETGGILLGHVLDNGIWIVMEVLPPGINCIFETAYFEYDDDFVNYLAQSVANQYKTPLELLGLWHRHPGSMDFFSATDNQTNATFAAQNPYGVISGLVNIDPKFRLTMYYMGNPTRIAVGTCSQYEKIPIEVGDDIIPEKYFELRYYDGEEDNLHPSVDRAVRPVRFTDVNSSNARRARRNPESPGPQNNAYTSNISGNSQSKKYTTQNKLEETVIAIIRFFRRNRFLLILLLLIVFAVSLKSSRKFLKTRPDTIEWIKRNSDNRESKTTNICDEKQTLSKNSLTLHPGQSDTLSIVPTSKKVKWASSDDTVATVNERGIVTAHAEGTCSITYQIIGNILGSYSVIVIKPNEDMQEEAPTKTEEAENNLMTPFL